MMLADVNGCAFTFAVQAISGTSNRGTVSSMNADAKPFFAQIALPTKDGGFASSLQYIKLQWSDGQPPPRSSLLPHVETGKLRLTWVGPVRSLEETLEAWQATMRDAAKMFPDEKYMRRPRGALDAAGQAGRSRGSEEDEDERQDADDTAALPLLVPAAPASLAHSGGRILRSAVAAAPAPLAAGSHGSDVSNCAALPVLSDGHKQWFGASLPELPDGHKRGFRAAFPSVLPQGAAASSGSSARQLAAVLAPQVVNGGRLHKVRLWVALSVCLRVCVRVCVRVPMGLSYSALHSCPALRCRRAARPHPLQMVRFEPNPVSYVSSDSDSSAVRQADRTIRGPPTLLVRTHAGCHARCWRASQAAYAVCLRAAT